MAGPRFVDVDPDEFPMQDSGAFIDALGLEFDLVSRDRLEAHLDAGPQHHQPYGIVHGGLYCSVVETLGSMAGAINAGEGNVVVGVANTTSFLRAHREGRLDVVATPIHRGRSQQLWLVEVSRPDDGKLVARGELRLQALPADRMLAGKPAQGGGA